MNSVQALFARTRWIALIAGALGLIACAIGAFLAPRDFFISWLWAVVFWSGLSLGCLGVFMIHGLTGGHWGFIIRRFLEAGMTPLPIMGILFIPVFFGLHTLYPWANPILVASDEVLATKTAYLNTPGYVIRTVVVFAVLSALAWWLLRLSKKQDATADVEPTRRMRAWSGPGLVAWPLLGTFASVDWIMSLEAHWYSTMFAVLICAGQMLSATAFAVFLLALTQRREPLAMQVTPRDFHQLANLLLAFVMLWTYMAFSEFLIIWNGNLPHEIIWYLHRSAGGWRRVIGALFGLHFLLPFALLLSREIKRKVPALAGIAITVFCAHMVSMFWMVKPAFYSSDFSLHWLDVAAPLGIGCVWLFIFSWRVSSRPIIPLGDPRFEIHE